MAKLDAIIEKLFKDAGQELLFETGNGVNMRTAFGLLPVLKQNLTSQQILGALAELVPPEQRGGFPAEGPNTFTYQSPGGAVQVKLEHLQGHVKASVTPVTPGYSAEGELELASPAEMMQLAAEGFTPSFATPIPIEMPAPTPVPVPQAARPVATSVPVPAAVPAPPAPVPQNVRPGMTPVPLPAAALAGAPPRPAPAPQAARPMTAIPLPQAPGAVPSPPAPVTAPVPPAPVAVPSPPAPVASEPPQVQVSRETPEQKREMLGLLELMLSRRASDLHLASETVPHLRVDGDMVPVSEYAVLSSQHLKALLFSIAPEKNKKQWEEAHDTDFAYETEAARFRVNVFEDRKGIGAVLRQIPNTIRTAEEMGLSKHILDLCFLSKGLVLVTGPTGSGKSTTLAAMIDYVNRHREDHIITIEDPIEFVHKNKSCLVNQREVGVHTNSFKNALRAALREDPDVVLVGEMRDLETIAIAIETAETGHLVFGTLHTNTAASTVDRIIDQFPSDRQAQIRMMLSESLKGVITQTLCKRIGGGRVPAQEVLLCSGSVANLIREGKTFQIPSVMQTSRGQGMTMLNDALLELVKKKVVEPNEALSKSVARSEMRAMLERAGFKVEAPAEASGAPTK
ncbi:type IV pilus twitching motility protein PilT [Stigmatella sp. ncwal1]|uniref:Type IV pilus twitching motility protein PilT n=1 Tax=Stigmatella ashevillensis TaxID=2995309 RepID=A0ABT5DCN7_9BACT|nr:type IV pilus twitching motility protein PilT [Stigmatella ashevillena]MDC0711379.1 type IV pilus twitching motility protein PilT [Stigmatella ashevillena]